MMGKMIQRDLRNGVTLVVNTKLLTEEKLSLKVECLSILTKEKIVQLRQLFRDLTEIQPPLRIKKNAQLGKMLFIVSLPIIGNSQMVLKKRLLK